MKCYHYHVWNTGKATTAVHVNIIQRVCSLRSHTPLWVAACMLLQSGNGRWAAKRIKISRHCACFSISASGYTYPSISQEQKLIGVVAARVETTSLQQKSVSQSSPTAKANRSDLTSSFWLGRQLQADMCKCKSWSYSRPLRVPNHPSSTWQRGCRRSLWHRPSCFQPAPCLIMATIESRSSDSRWTPRRTHRQTDSWTTV